MRCRPSAAAARPPARPRPRPLIALAALLAAPAAHAADRIYWSNYDGDSIAYANLNGNGGGGTVNTTGATVDGPMGLADRPLPGADLLGQLDRRHRHDDLLRPPRRLRRRRPRDHRDDDRRPARARDRPHGRTLRAASTGPITTPTRSPTPTSTAPAAAPAATSRSPTRPSTSRAGDDRPAHRPPLLVELRRRPRDDDLLRQPRRHRRRRPADIGPTRRGSRGHRDRSRHPEDLLVRLRQ